MPPHHTNDHLKVLTNPWAYLWNMTVGIFQDISYDFSEQFGTALTADI